MKYIVSVCTAMLMNAAMATSVPNDMAAEKAQRVERLKAWCQQHPDDCKKKKQHLAEEIRARHNQKRHIQSSNAL